MKRRRARKLRKMRRSTRFSDNLEKSEIVESFKADIDSDQRLSTMKEFNAEEYNQYFYKNVRVKKISKVKCNSIIPRLFRDQATTN